MAISAAMTTTLDPAWLVRPVARLAAAPDAASVAPPLCALESGGELMAVIRVPDDPDEARRVREWAALASVPADPLPCGDQTVIAGTLDTAGMAATAHIQIPQPGSVIAQAIPIIGSALFDPQEVQFYKVEWGYGSDPGEWITMGEGHPNPVADGVLETWYADSLPSGAYALRVVLVKRDGNYVATAPVAVVVER